MHVVPTPPVSTAPDARPEPPLVLAEPYRPRTVCFLRLLETAGWRLKLYGISYAAGQPSPALVAAAERIAVARLPSPAVADDRYGVGFVGAHDGRGAAFVFVGWWTRENELALVVHSAPANAPDALRAHQPGESVACVWDLAVIGFEREAWLETVLRNPRGPDLDAYLARRLSGEV